MSYCRFSSDDFQCDVYVYEDCAGGWTTHVGSGRLVFREPLPPEVPIDDSQAWIDRHMKVTGMIAQAGHAKIGLPYDGEIFNDPTPGECADRLESLRSLGYVVPQYAIDELREESQA